MKKKLIFLLAMGAPILILILQNSQVITIHFLMWNLSMSQIILFSAILIIGITIGFIIGRKSWDW